MFTSRSLLVLVFVLVFPFPGPAGELRVLSFNVRYENSGDGLNAWTHRKETAAKLIAEYDVAGLQEVKPGQRAWLRGALPDYELVGIGREKDDTDESASIAFRKDRLKLEKTGTFWLSETPEVVASKSWDSSLPRVCTWAVLRDIRDGARLAVFNVHLDHRGAEAREKGIALVLERMSAVGAPVLLMGDFNCTETSAPIRNVRAWQKPVLVRSTDATGAMDEGTFHNFTGKAGGAAIDFIFAEKGRVEIRKHAVLKTAYRGEDGSERPVSDHFPVAAVVAVGKE
jgi:endonuclease/exonuclease/phosphatase family metal-dependent hydrolase